MSIIVIDKNHEGKGFVSAVRSRDWFEADELLEKAGLFPPPPPGYTWESYAYFNWVDIDRVVAVLRLAGLSVEVEGSDDYKNGYFEKHKIPQVCAILRLNGYEVEVEE